MPTYEYKREDGSVFEVIQSISDDPLKTCPTTGQPVKRVISGGGGVVYKGSGWYVTDYKNKNNGNATNGMAKTEPKASTGENQPENKTSSASSPDSSSDKPTKE